MYQLYNKRPCVKKQGLLAVHCEPKHNVVLYCYVTRRCKLTKKYIRPFCIDKKRKQMRFCVKCVFKTIRFMYGCSLNSYTN